MDNNPHGLKRLPSGGLSITQLDMHPDVLGSERD